MSASARSIVLRPGVAAAGRIIQRAQLTSHRVAVDLPTLIFVQNGQKTVSWSTGECTAGAGEAIAIEGGQVVDISNAPGVGGAYNARWISWTEAAVNFFRSVTNTVAPFSVGSLLERPPREFRNAFDAAFDSLLNVDGVPASVANHRSQEVLLWLHEHGVVFHSSLESFSARMRRLIQSNPAYAWSIDEAARRARCSPATLRRRLTAENVTFRELLQDARMSQALILLQNTESPVLSVAFAVGYESASRFASRFRLRFGYLPSDIRGHKRGSKLETFGDTPSSES
jgi:AraC-like DNA-binding protein